MQDVEQRCGTAAETRKAVALKTKAVGGCSCVNERKVRSSASNGTAAAATAAGGMIMLRVTFEDGVDITASDNFFT